MRKILLIFLPLFFIVKLGMAQPDLTALTVSAGASGCSLSASQNVVVLIQNTGTTDLSNVTFNLSYTINGGAPITDVGVSFPFLPATQFQSHTFTVHANLSTPGSYILQAYVSNLAGDIDQTNDTTLTSTTTNTSSVGGVVTSNATVCAGANSGTLNLSGQTGTVQKWQSSLNGTTWVNIANLTTSQNYLNLIDTTYYRAIVKHGACALDSSTPAKIIVTPIPFLSSNLNTGVCDGSTFTYTMAAIGFPSPTFTWTKLGYPWFRVNADTGSAAGDWNPIVNVFHTNTDSSEHYAFYRVTTTSNGCTNSGETVTIRIDSLKPVASGPITGITPVCQGTMDGAYSIAGVIHAAWYQWSYTGTGEGFTSSTNNTNILFSPTATSGNLFVNAENFCGQGAASPNYAVTVDTAVLAAAGGPNHICQSAAPIPYTLAGSSVGGPFGTVGTWSIISGGGSLSFVGSTNTPDTVTYTPAANFKGTVTLRLTTDNPGAPCGFVTSDRTIKIDTAVIDIAGGPDTFCQAAQLAPFHLTGASIGGPFGTVGTWSIFAGGGSLSLLTPTNTPDTVTYTPAPNFTGTITLRLTSNNPGTSCGAVITDRTINVNPKATVSAGGDDSVCAGNTYLLAGTRGGGASSSTWTTLGDGLFSDPTIVNAVYTPGATDITNGTVMLIITTDNPAGPCAAVADSMNLRIDAPATVIAGGPNGVCDSPAPAAITLGGASVGGSATTGQWTIFAGTGTLSPAAGFQNNAGIAATTFTPTASFPQVVTLRLTTNNPGTACGAVFADRTITIDPAAAVTAGGPDSVCDSPAPIAITLGGASVGGAAITGAWSIISGSGVLSSTAQQANAGIALTTYTPAANTPETVTLRLTTNDPGTSCGAVFSDRTIRVDPIATVIAGGPDNVCDSGTPGAVTLGGASIGGAAITGQWTIISGTGTLSPAAGFQNNAGIASTTFTPTASFPQTVTLRLTTNNPGTSCGAISADRTITIDPAATVTAGGPDAVCDSPLPVAITLSGASVGGTAVTGAWSIIAGSGVLSSTAQQGNAGIAATTYTPAANTPETVTLRLTTNNPGTSCGAVSADRTITVDPMAIAIAGGPDDVCDSPTPAAITLSGASVGGSASTGAWSIVSGTGTLSSLAQQNNAGIVTTTFTPTASFPQTVTLRLTTNHPGTSCGAVFSDRTITVDPAPIVAAGGPNSVCESPAPAAITLSGASVGGSAVTGAWSIIAGSGVLSSTIQQNNAGIAATTYTPAVNTPETVTLRLTTNNPGTACGVVFADRTITIDQHAIAAAGGPNSICDSGTPGAFALGGASVGGSASTGAWSIVSGTGTLSSLAQQNNAGIAATTFTPTASFPQTVTLRLTTNNPGTSCGAVTSDRIITIVPKPIVVTHNPSPVCQPSTVDLTLPAVTAGSPGGLAYTYFTNAAATIHISDSSAVTASGTYYIVGTAVGGCSDTTSVDVVVNLAAIGGTVGNEAIVCSGANGDTLTLVGYSGTIQKWQYSTNGGTSWTDIVNTTPHQAYSNIITTTWYRAEMSATCASALSVEARITVDSHPLSVGGIVSSNHTVCSGANHDTINLTGRVGVILRWEYTIDGGHTWVYVNNTDSSLIYNNLTATTIYRAVVQNSVCGAAYSSNDTITVNPPSIAGTIGGAVSGCAGIISGTLLVSGYSGVIGWQYSTDNGITWIDSVNAAASQVYSRLMDTTMYKVIVKSGICKADTSAPASVIVYPKPIAMVAADTVCLGAATTFVNLSTIAGGFIQLNQWDFGDNNSSFSKNPTHIYGVAGIYLATLLTTSNLGCMDTAALNVKVNPLPSAVITASGPLSFCQGDSVNLSVAGGMNYLWSTTAVTPGITAKLSGVYQVTVTNPATLCTSSSSITVVVFPLPVVNAGNDVSISLGNSTTLLGQGAVTYTWLPAAGLNNPSIPTPIASPQVTTSYELIGTDINGCKDVDSVTVTVLVDYNVIITNLVTANGDGYNDKWIIKNIEFYPNTEVIVVNREGQQVYSSLAYDNSWDGTNKDGKPLPDGAYYYFIKFYNSDKLYKGAITILNEK